MGIRSYINHSDILSKADNALESEGSIFVCELASKRRTFDKHSQQIMFQESRSTTQQYS